LFRNVPPLLGFLVCASVVAGQYKPSLAHVHHTTFCMACVSLSFESVSPVRSGQIQTGTATEISSGRGPAAVSFTEMDDF